MDPATLWKVIESIGGKNGWYGYSSVWKLRSWADGLLGGAGMSRGRRDQRHLQPGDALDWWRVETVESGQMLRLRSEMRTPGTAWLEFSVSATENGSRLDQRTVFYPRGIVGRLYWFANLPAHKTVFAAMTKNIVAAAESLR